MTIAASYFDVVPLTDLLWPVSFRYWITAPWGKTRQELTVEVPVFNGEPEQSVALGLHLWKRGIAPAITRQVRLDLYETVVWKQFPFPVATPCDEVYGLLDGTASPRADSGVIIMHTGHGDDLSRRRLFLPGIPSAWVVGRQLGLGARDALESWGKMMGVAMSDMVPGSPMQWMLAYNELLPPAPGNVTGVGFRKVKWLRGCLHTGRAPEESSVVWP